MNQIEQETLNQELADRAGHTVPYCEDCWYMDTTCHQWESKPALDCENYHPAVLETEISPSAEKSEPNTKPSNPKEALGIKKVPLHCLPCGPLLELGLGMMEGGRKYGTHNYRKIGVRMSTYYDAAIRHIIAWWEGEDIDPDSGLHHVTKAMTALLVLRDSMIMGNCKDDRPIRYPDGFNMTTYNKKAEKIIEKYPKCKEPYINSAEEK